MQWAIVSIEDKRFYSESGVDIKGIARAFLNDLTGAGGEQGASTITEQLIKVMRGAYYKRSIFEKLTEAALAFQLAHKWSKSEILAEYLNNVYYGNGAWGIEAAAQTYFGNDPTSNLYGCDYDPSNPKNLCAPRLDIAQDALLAALVQNPPENWTPQIQQWATGRRDTVLLDMYDQGYIYKSEYVQAYETPVPASEYVIPPGTEYTKPGYGYFTSWVEQQILEDKAALPNPYTAGYHIHTTLDEPLQNEAESVVDSILPPGHGLPEAALVAIDNRNGNVLAMDGGYDYNLIQFNTATQAERQPGSSWKVFDLAKALELGVSPNQTYPSKAWTAKVPGFAPFHIENDEASYAGTRTLASGLTYSDNTVYARVGIEDGLPAVADYAHDFGITTDISQNPSMTIGGLFTGVTALDMAHAYSTIADGGQLVSGSLASQRCAGGIYVPPNAPEPIKFSESLQAVWPPNSCPGPNGITVVNRGRGQLVVANQLQYRQVPYFTASMDQTEQEIMRTVVTEGTGTNAFIPNVYVIGKTGTTSDYRDAWFIGSAGNLTVAVWVGFNDDASMSTAYGGKAVYGGTYPAIIFNDFMEEALSTLTEEAYDQAHHISETPLIAQTAPHGVIVPTSSLPAYSDGPSSSSNSTTTNTANTTTPAANTTTTPANTTTTTPANGGAGTTQTAPTPTAAGGGAAAP